MRNAINACKVLNTRLIFFDNVYMYGKVDGAMTEETPFNPISKKGKLRAEIATTLLNEMNAGNIKALIARAADFYGPNTGSKSVIGVLAIDKLLKNKTPQTLVTLNHPHSYTYTTDAAKALYILAKHDEAFNQTWHLPTASPALTAKQFIELVAAQTNGTNKIQVLPKFVITVAGWFNILMKELNEMLYQNEFAYIFNSSKFDKTFNFAPTTYKEGIKKTIEWIKLNETTA